MSTAIDLIRFTAHGSWGDIALLQPCPSEPAALVMLGVAFLCGARLWGREKRARTVAFGMALALGISSSVTATPLRLDYTTRGNATIAADPRLFPYGEYVDKVPYKVDTEDWRVFLDPDRMESPIYLRDTAGTFIDVLSAAFPVANGWNYASSANPLSDDSLVVRKYAARHPGSSVGADFLVEYVPHAGDPAAANIHWIQVVTNNHKKGAEHGIPDRKVDSNYTLVPYYDYAGTADGRFFSDKPRREDDNPHNWKAFLFLVTGPPVTPHGKKGKLYPDPGDVTFYGGIHWGWKNECIVGDISVDCKEVDVSEPPVLALLALVATMIAGRSRFRAAHAA